jgi:uncharacterized protein (TIGR02679 family)
MSLDKYRTPAWSWLTGPMRAALDEAPGRQTVTVDFTALPAEAADRYADLLGLRARPTGRTRVSIARVDEALRATPAGMSLVALLEALGGPLENRREQRADTRAALANVWVAVREQPALTKHPQLSSWLDTEQVQASRLPADAGRRLDIVTAALDVAQALPAPGIGRARLSWQVFRDTKALSATALDQHRRACVLRAVAVIADRDVPADPAAERELWEAVGVSVDPLSSRVLVAGLAPSGQQPVAQSLRLKASTGLASVLTLADVDAWASAGISGMPERVFVCENPEVAVAALAELGVSCPALICTEGRPHLAAVRLVAALVEAGVSVVVHADFDWDGLSIVGTITKLGAEPWRMTAEEYLAAAVAASADGRALPALTGATVASPWCPELQHAMSKRKVEVHEEDDGVLATLLRDLADATSAAAPVVGQSHRWPWRRR